MPSFKGAELGSVPLASSALSAHALAYDGVAQLMIHNRLDPSTCAWLKELTSHDHSPLPDVA